MDKDFQRYIAEHGIAVDATSMAISTELAHPLDTDRDTRRMIRDARKALHRAIQETIAGGPNEGWPLGMCGEIVVVIRVPRNGQGSRGTLGVMSARLVSTGLVPVPSGWPQESPPLDPFARAMNDSIFRSPGQQRIVDVDEFGQVPLGRDFAQRQLLLDELPDGEIWLRPLDSPIGSEP